MADILTPSLLLTEPPKIPEKWQEAIREFLMEFFRNEVWWFQNHWGYRQIVGVGPNVLMRTFLAEHLALIAWYAEGKDLNRIEVADTIQAVMEHLFACVPNVFHIPREFWMTPVGWMILQAQLRVEGDELITLSEAAKMLNRSLSTVSDMVRRGTLSGYPDPTEPNPRKRMRVRKSEVEALREKKDSATNSR